MALLAHYSNKIEAGCDEAGRGCLAGPVVAAAVILKNDANYPELNDSKQLTEKKRMQLRELVMKEALSYGIGIVTAKEIDEINILNASFLAMHRALDQLTLQPELLLIDGNRFNPYKKVKHVCIVGGDAKYQSIASGASWQRASWGSSSVPSGTLISMSPWPTKRNWDPFSLPMVLTSPIACIRRREPACMQD